MKNLLLASALVSSQAMAQTGSTTYVYDLKYHESSLVASTPIGKLHDVLGKGIDLDVDAFLGTNLDKKGQVVAGFTVGRRFPLAKEATGFVGIGLNLQDGRSVSPVFAFGAGWKF